VGFKPVFIGVADASLSSGVFFRNVPEHKPTSGTVPESTPGENKPNSETGDDRHAQGRLMSQ